MSKKIIKEEIVRLLEAIVDQTQTIDQYKGVVPRIELDLIMENIRQLYQYYTYLAAANNQMLDAETSAVKEEEKPQKIPHKDQQSEKEVDTEEKKDQPHMEEIKKKQTPKEVSTPPKKETTPPKEETTPPKGESPPAKQVSTSPEEENIPTKKEGSPKEETPPTEGSPFGKKEKVASKPDLFTSSSGTLADKLQQTAHSSLYDRLGKPKKEGTLSERLKGNPVKDIKSAIGINEKFLFINELFQGNVHDYNDAIKALNSAEGLEEALEVFQKLHGEYQWKKDTPAVLQLLNFVERRHM